MGAKKDDCGPRNKSLLYGVRGIAVKCTYYTKRKNGVKFCGEAQVVIYGQVGWGGDEGDRV